jgi:hypothetical protein
VLSVHPTDALIPPLLVGAGVLMAWSGSLLLGTAANGPSPRAVVLLSLSLLAAFAYFALIYAMDPRTFASFDPGTIGLFLVPAVMAVVGVFELMYLFVARLPRPRV